MTDQITVNVEDLRVRLHGRFEPKRLKEAGENLRAALAEHDKAEQERLDALVFLNIEDGGKVRNIAAPNLRWEVNDWWRIDPLEVESWGDFYPHQEHAYVQGCAGGCGGCCDSPEWAHTPPEPKVPDWQTDPDVLVVEDKSGRQWVRQAGYWGAVENFGGMPWDTLLNRYGPITPVGWRRDPDSITLPGVLRDRSADWWRDAADHGAKQGYPRYVNMACRLIADALEADQ